MEWFACTLFSHTKHPVPAVTASSLVRQSHWHLDVLMLGVCFPLSHGVCCRQQLHGTHCYQGHEGILWGGSQDRRGRFEGKLLICKTDSTSSVFIENCCWRLGRLSDTSTYLTSGLTTFGTVHKVKFYEYGVCVGLRPSSLHVSNSLVIRKWTIVVVWKQGRHLWWGRGLVGKVVGKRVNYSKYVIRNVIWAHSFVLD